MARPRKAELVCKELYLANANLSEELLARDAKFATMQSDHLALHGEHVRQSESYEKLIRTSAVAHTELDRIKRRLTELEESNRRLKSLIARTRQERDIARGYISRVVEDDIVQECGPTTQTAPLIPMRGRPTASVGTRRERDMYREVGGVDDEEFWNM